METIRTYLNNVFANLPNTEQTRKLKEELFSNMEEKYVELKAQGHSENEAIGVVISEFGNIDELVQEMNLESASFSKKSFTKETTGKVLDQYQIQDILAEKQKWTTLIAVGVFCCIMAPAFLVLLSSTPFDKFLGMPMFFLIIAGAVGLFIISGTHLERYDYLKAEDFRLSDSARIFAEQERNSAQTKYSACIAVGVMLCILSPLCVIIFDSLSHFEFISNIGVFLMLFFIACAVFLFIAGSIKVDTLKQLLKEAEYAPCKKKENKVIRVAASIFWPVVTVVYLLWSFVNGNWGISWIIWPVSGILFGAFSAVVSILTEPKESSAR